VTKGTSADAELYFLSWLKCVAPQGFTFETHFAQCWSKLGDCADARSSSKARLEHIGKEYRQFRHWLLSIEEQSDDAEGAEELDPQVKICVVG
jgi:hypothetical protein